MQLEIKVHPAIQVMCKICCQGYHWREALCPGPHGSELFLGIHGNPTSYKAGGVKLQLFGVHLKFILC